MELSGIKVPEVLISGKNLTLTINKKYRPILDCLNERKE